MYFGLFGMGIDGDMRYVLGVLVIGGMGGMMRVVGGGLGWFEVLFLVGMEEVGYDEEGMASCIVL